ncbi:hypothetical protein E1A91_A11G256400v1 [Gossypium mustelinum]|uniref:Uncharacterized protein n=1 Tax=Gossypium mustelinum TaxID=34275 RepID=A0A5D2XAQ0_GOSMU|nr:hypothetical protein E1A91_A11G256400v1 [Gossypium mustelinum]
MFNSPQGNKQSLQKSMRKVSPGASQKDLWLAVREGSLPDVDSVLALLKKAGGNINSRNSFGLTPLHIATWRNNIPVIRRLLAAGADPDARDGESGWSSLHRALHFGHLAVASVLLQSGASITLEDSKCRTPVDLLSGPVLQVFGSAQDSVATEVFSWGSGVNYQLGTGNAHIQKLPCKLDSFHGSKIKLVSAAKFHSIAVTARGEVYTWGFGRGGRLGHPDFDIHSGQAAVITPRQVTSGLGAHRVKAIAAAKHHTVIATEGGDVFTWGSNREGQLGYTSVDTQPTPRRVSSLRSRIVAVAAANKHTAVVSASGEVFTWGCNREGQLGYGTSNSASNYTPRIVEYLKSKVFVGVATAKYHTIVLGADGEVYTWGHRLVTPRRVVITRNLKKSGSTPLKFHRKERLHVVAIAAGMVHSIAMTEDGALFYWVSSDPDLRCQQLYSLCGKKMVSISAGKYWAAAATATGDVYMWDGKQSTDKPPVATRLHGVKRATSVSVGETHLLTIGSVYHPVYPPSMPKSDKAPKLKVNDEVEEFDEECMFDDLESSSITSAHKNDSEQKPIPSLKSLCEKVAAECLVKPRNAIQLLEIADSLGADDLKKHCEEENRGCEGATQNEASIESTFFVQKKDSSVPAKDKGTSQTATKKKNRKGGLSMFLSGALDDSPKQVTPLPPTPRSEGPAWGGAKVSKGSASLREIQDEQSKIQVNQKTGSKNQVEDLFAGKSEGKILLSSYLPSKPIPVVSVQTPQASDAERSTPPWASSGTPPHLSRPSLRDIQMQQQGKQLHGLSHSPKMKMSGFSVASSQGSPSDSPGVNRWFKPEIEAPSSIRSIQIEERAIKDLKRFYSSVKVVKNQS